MRIIFSIGIMIALGTQLCIAQTIQQRGIDSIPVAHNDTVSVVLPDTISVNVAANDSDADGDSLCITAIYGSTNFSLANCTNIIFYPDTGFTSSIDKDTCWYVICDDGDILLCDTAMLIVTIYPHYTPFMLNNSRWTDSQYDPACQNQNASYNTQTIHYYWTIGDTFINGLAYKSFFKIDDFINTSCDGVVLSSGASNPYLGGYLRQDTVGKKVFFLGVDSLYEVTLYNFNLSVGDTVNSLRPYVPASVVYFIDSFVTGGISYRRFNFFSNDNDFSSGESWIEGIGSTYGLFREFDIYGGLNCFSSNSVTIYPYYLADTCDQSTLGIENIKMGELVISPNPTSDVCTLKLIGSAGSYSASILDITGREVMPLFSNQPISTFNFNMQFLSAGLYFVKMYDQLGHFYISKLVKE